MTFSNIVYDKVTKGGRIQLDGVELDGYVSFKFAETIIFNKIPVVAIRGNRQKIAFSIPGNELFSDETPHFDFELNSDFNRVLAILTDYIFLEKKSPHLTVRNFEIVKSYPQGFKKLREISNQKWSHLWNMQ